MEAMDERFQISPLIRGTLIGVYLALVLPLPLMAPAGLRPLLLLAAPIGLALVWALLSEEVLLNDQRIQVGYPRWCAWLLRRGWQLPWQEISRLIPMGTSQGGTVYYVSSARQEHYLLPQRLNRFNDFLERFQAASGVNTSQVQRLTPPWTYQLLALLAALMLTSELVVFGAMRVGWLTLPAGPPG
jgi:hypothetical protein